MLRSLCRKCGPPQFGSPGEVTHPVQGSSLAGSCTIQAPAFSGDFTVTHFSGSLVFTGRVPLSVISTVAAGFLTMESRLGPHIFASHTFGQSHPPRAKFIE